MARAPQTLPLAALGAARVALAALAISSSGCLGDFARMNGGDGGASGGDGSALGDAGNPARAEFDSQVKPILDGACSVCHDRDGAAGPSFLKPVAYDTLHVTPGMVTPNPGDSLLVTKGKHEGPAFTPAQAPIVLAWLTVEAKLLPPPNAQTYTTMPMLPKAGANKIDLGALGSDFVGTSITFDSQLLQSTLELSNITVHTDGAHGVRIVHPLFIVVSNGVKVPDPVDSFAGLDLSVAQGNATTLGPGTLFLDGVGALDQIEIGFQTLSKYDANGGGMDGGVVQGGGGCKDVMAFTADAQPTLASRCLACHGGSNQLATAATDMTKVNDLSQQGQSDACAQVKNRIDTTTVANSDIFLVTNPKGNANHPFKFNGDSNAWNAFVQAATQWVNSEK